MLQHYLVVGLGVTGYSVVEYLVKQGYEVSVTDSRANPPELNRLQLNFSHLQVFWEQIVVPDNTTHIILSPGIALNTPAIAQAQMRGVQVYGDIELFAKIVDKPVIAITGSNGKSTTTALLGAMAKNCQISAGVGGNLGTPALQLLNPHHDCYILELSSFQLETTHSLACRAATVLNISPDHMDRYSSLDAYTQAKLRIYAHAEVAVVNRHERATFPNSGDKQIISFGLDNPADNHYGVIVEAGVAWLARGAQKLMRVNDMAMLGQHNVANALAALALGEAAGFTQAGMLQTLREFAGLEHRCEKVLQAHSVVWVNDSKGTNVGATLAAIEGLGTSIAGRWVIILGGVGKNADFRPLMQPLSKYCKSAILIGSDAPILFSLLKDLLPCYMAVDLQDAVRLAKLEVQAGDGVLLSPACASLDMFANYAQRGEIFKQLVLQEMGSSVQNVSAKAI